MITAEQVKELRQSTGVGMMECKKALTENDGDMEKAVLWLRERGLSRAASKAGRTAAEGIVEIASNPGKTAVAMVELNCETDFSAKNQDFRNFATTITQMALSKKINDLETLKSQPLNSSTVAEELTLLIQKVGENMNLRRITYIEEPEGFVASYVHMGGKIGSVVKAKGAPYSDCAELAADLAMHVAACAPKYFVREEVTFAELEQERELSRKRLEEQGKTGDMVGKIVEGQMNKFYGEVCFSEQPFVKEPKLTILKYAAQQNPKVKITGFVRYQLGEGIEVKKENFADEVAAQLNKK